LFFAEKKPADMVVYESPLNYMGSKSLLVPVIREQLPASINSFVDLFGGGLNVGINVDAVNVIYNDINFFAKQIIESPTFTA
jgi:adenine-specific DNA-methyltransferase